MPTCVHMYMCNRRRHFPCDPCNKLKKPGPRVGNAYFIIEQAVSAAYKQLYFRHLPSLLIWHECRKSNKQTVLKFRSYSATKNCKCLLLQNIWQPCNLFLCWHFRLYVCVFVRVVLPLVQNFFNAQLTNLKHLTKVRAIKVLLTKKKNLFDCFTKMYFSPKWQPCAGHSHLFGVCKCAWVHSCPLFHCRSLSYSLSECMCLAAGSKQLRAAAALGHQ